MRTTIARASARTKGTLIAAVVLSLVLTSTVLAGTGVGAVFNLGQANAVNARSILSGRVNAALLFITNSSTAYNAAALVTTSRSATSATLIAENHSNGPALSLSTGDGVPPMTVNSESKVDNLNADLLDGYSARSFMTGSTFSMEVPTDQGILAGDGTYIKSASCPYGTVLLSGGPASIDKTSTVLDSFPTGTPNEWRVRINTNGVNDAWTVVVLCGEMP